MVHSAMCIDRFDLFNQLWDAAEAVMNAESGEVLEFSAGDAVIHFVIIDEEKEESSDD